MKADLRLARLPRGFTLLEVVIAIAIFAGVFIAAQQMFSQAMSSRDRLDERAARMEGEQLLLTWLTMDLEQMIARPVRDSFGDPQPAVVALENGIAFTRAGWANPFSLRRRSELQRVEYFRDEQGRLIRRHWPSLDINPGTRPEDAVMLEDVDAFQVRYLSRDGTGQWQWLETWPDPGSAAKAVLLQPLPKSIEVTVLLRDGRSLHRFYRTVDNPWTDPL